MTVTLFGGMSQAIALDREKLESEDHVFSPFAWTAPSEACAESLELEVGSWTSRWDSTMREDLKEKMPKMTFDIRLDRYRGHTRY
jgi:hypothetical protein